MKRILDFIWYCIKSMLDLFSAMFGHVSDESTIKDTIVGFVTLIIIASIIIIILYFTGIIRLKK